MVPHRLQGLVLVAVMALAVAGCGGGTVQVDFSRSESTVQPATASAPRADVVRMAIGSMLSSQPTLAQYEQLADYLGGKLGRPVQLVEGKTYGEVNNLVESGDVTLAYVCTNPYLQGRQDFGMEMLAAPEVHGETSYYSLLIVGRDVNARSLADLRGGTFAFSDPLSNSGRLVPLYYLARLGQTPDSFFSRTIFTYSHDKSIRAVADGIVQAAAVDSMVFDYMRVAEPGVTDKVKVIERWGPFGVSPFVVNPRLDPTLKAKLQQILLDMDEDPQGKAVLQRLMVDRYVVPDDHTYDSVRVMRAYLREHGLVP